MYRYQFESKGGKVEEIKAYCMACQTKVRMLPPISKEHTKNGRYVYIGFCDCGRRVAVIRQEPRVKVEYMRLI